MEEVYGGMRQRFILAALGILSLVGLTGMGPQSVSSSLELQKLLVNDKEVQDAFSSSWRLIAKTKVADEPAHSMSAALIYGNGQTSMLTMLFQFEREEQAVAYMEKELIDVLDAKEVLSRVEQDELNETFRVGQSEGADSVELVKLLMGVRSDPDEDEQQLVLRFRAGRMTALFAVRFCIPPHPDPQSGVPVEYQCFDESRLTTGLTELGETQLKVLFTGRD